MVQKIEDPQTVLIIGAGAAGLTAAEELQKAGQDYLILEGRDRIGGRIDTQNWPLTHPTNFELGAAWFHDVPHNRLAAAAESEGFEAIYDDEYSVIYDRDGKLDQNLVNELSTKFDEFRKKRDSSDPLDQVATLFAREQSNEDHRRTALAIAYGYQLFTGAKAAQIGAHVQGPQGRDQAVQGGFIKLFKDLLAKDVDPSRVKFNKNVNQISSQGDRVRVSTQDGEHFEGKAVIVTAPVGVLKSGNIQFEPKLNGKIQKALNSLQVAHVDKIYLTFPETFWERSTYKFIISDAESPALIWNWEPTHPGTQQKNTLAVLVTNDTAYEVQKNPDDAFNIVKPLLKAIAPGVEKIPEPTQVIRSDWIQDEFSQGSFSVVPHGETREELAKPFEEGEVRNRVFFAGEHASVEGAALVQGAWLSGQRAAKQVLEL